MNAIVQQTPATHQTMDYQVNRVFGVKAPDNVTIKGLAPGHSRQEFVPRGNAQHVFGSLTGELHAWYAHIKDPLMVVGPTGCGKSSTIVEMASRLNIPLHRVNGHARLEPGDLEGYKALSGGKTYQDYGPLAQAMTYGEWFMMDEIDRCDPTFTVWLNTILEGAPLVIAGNGGEVIRPKKGFRFIATANTNGDGGMSSNGSYGSAMRQDMAYMDRFMLVETDYLDPQVELNVVLNAFRVDSSIAERMIKVANSTRKAFLAGEIDVTFSTRTLLRWVHLMMLFSAKPDSWMFSLNRALGFRTNETGRQLLKEYLTTHGLVSTSNQGGNK